MGVGAGGGGGWGGGGGGGGFVPTNSTSFDQNQVLELATDQSKRLKVLSAITSWSWVLISIYTDVYLCILAEKFSVTFISHSNCMCKS